MMQHSERIVDYVRRFPGRDDGVLSAELRILPRQTVNQACRKLATAGLIIRRPGPSGKIVNYPSDFKTTGPAQFNAPHAKMTPMSPNDDATADWFWEGNVTDAVALYLRERGWTIRSQADTRSKARGLDLHASKDGCEIVVEAKGYPSRFYRSGARAGRAKPTSPTLQAHHWYAQALLKVVRLQTSHAGSQAVIALPDFPRYRALVTETQAALCKLGIAVVLVAESGGVEAHNLIEPD